MIIHGDNLEVLKALLPQYEGKVDCIYIDPPYNTGNEGWVYNDNVNDPRIKKWLGEVVGKEGEDLTRHDKWLCMMYPRLRLLHRLLAPTGVIFISIDDNEQANLKLICDEIFGVKNFVATIPWQSRQSLQNDTDLSINHEFILTYAKKRRYVDRRLKESNASYWDKIPEFAFSPMPVSEDKYSNPDNDPRGPWKADPLDAPNIRPNLTYPITNPKTGEQHLPPRGRCWRISPEKFSSAMEDGRILFGKNGTSRPQLKVFLREKERFGSVPNSWFSAAEAGTATRGTKQLQALFPNQKLFDTPKPIDLLEKILSMSVRKDALILDSFAGSGTTAHAVLNLNKQDGGNRRFILCEMMDYADTITAERVKRVIDGYGEGKKAVEGTSGSFSYYELGEPLLIDGDLNPEIGPERVREYIWFTETQQPFTSPNLKYHPSFLGVSCHTAYHLIYHPDQITTLNHQFVRTLTPEVTSDHQIIYADICTLSEEELTAFSMTFKKIPRDIARL